MMSITNLRLLGSICLVAALILSGCGGAGAGGGGSVSSGAPPTDLVNGSLPGPPSGGVSNTPSSPNTPTAPNVISGPPPASVQLDDPGGPPAGIDTSDSAPVSAPSDTSSNDSKALMPVLDLSSISASDPNWNKSWVVRGSDKLSGKAPPWLIAHAANQPANAPYLVSFWNPAWQGILEKQIKKMESSGSSGVYLTGSERFAASESQDPNAAEDMSTLIVALADSAHTRSASFVVVPMGAETLLKSLNDTEKQQYLDAIGAPQDSASSTNANPQYAASSTK